MLVSLRKEHELQMFEYKESKKYLNFKKDGENAHFTVLLNDKRDLYSPSSFVRIVKCRMLQLTRHVARTVRTKYQAYRKSTAGSKLFFESGGLEDHDARTT
jgi:hypothetical protein